MKKDFSKSMERQLEEKSNEPQATTSQAVVQEDGTQLVNVRFPKELLGKVEEFKVKKVISTRTNAIFELLELGLNGPTVEELPAKTLRDLQTMLSIRRILSSTEGKNVAYLTLNEIQDIEELLLSVSTILSNLNFYKNRMRDEGYTALADMGELAYEKL